MSKNRKFLNIAAQSPALQANHLDPNVARQSPIIFSFKNLVFDKKPFDCTTGDADGMLYILKTFRLFSEVIRKNLEMTYPKCHAVPPDQVSKHNLVEFVSKAPSGKLHQIGRERTPERIIGYFDSPISNLFQVCLLDLHHNLSGD